MNVNKLLIFFVIQFFCKFCSIICSNTISESDYENCIFVPFWQCKEDLSGLIPSNVIDYHPYSQIDNYDVCCKNECGRRVPGEHITENKRTSFGEFPWMLELFRNGKYICGASLIHPKVVLTAAHCVYDLQYEAGYYVVRGGVWNRSRANDQTADQTRYVAKKVIHPDFRRREPNFFVDPFFGETLLVNDIALLILDRPFYMNKNVGLICLDKEITLTDYSNCIVTGWGEPSGENYENILKKVDLTLVDHNMCTHLWLRETGKIFNLHPSSICAGGLNQDSCRGDGGSPLVCAIVGEVNRYEQVGIVSWGLSRGPCGSTNAPGIYTNLLYFKNWIYYVLSKNGLSTSTYNYLNYNKNIIPMIK